MTVQEGPGVKWSFSEVDELKPEQYPFAMRLRRHLEKRGAVVACVEEEFKIGACMVEAGVVVSWSQLVVVEDKPEELGDEILERFGPHVSFGMLITPSKSSVECCSQQRAGNVVVRHILCYEHCSDRVEQRFDVLVRKTER